jgi:hypothetical protein
VWACKLFITHFTCWSSCKAELRRFFFVPPTGGPSIQPFPSSLEVAHNVAEACREFKRRCCANAGRVRCAVCNGTYAAEADGADDLSTCLFALAWLDGQFPGSQACCYRCPTPSRTAAGGLSRRSGRLAGQH